MAEQLKKFFDERVVRSIARDLRRVYPRFDERRFVAQGLHGLDALELMPRAWHLADAMWAQLPRPFSAAAEVLVAALGPEGGHKDGAGMEPFRYLPFTFVVARYGLDDFEASMAAQHALTQRFSAEFSIRPFIERYPDAAFARLVQWAKDPSVHVRRLVSEGTRPRLPWAPRLRAFQKDPAPVLRLLELLKDDPERYVQRSVANSLNDIGKDHPELLVETCRRWAKDAPPGRAWIIRHASRSLVKKGHRGALALHGAGAPAKVRIRGVELTPRIVRFGGKLRFSFSLVSTAREPQSLVVDYAVHFMKANGVARPKVFKLKRLDLAPGAHVELSRSVSFQRMTTRRHYTGRHELDVRINGVSRPLGTFEVRR